MKSKNYKIPKSSDPKMWQYLYQIASSKKNDVIPIF